MLKYCPFCGRSIPLDARLCPYCSKSIGLNEGITIQEPLKKKDRTALIVILVIILFVIVPAIIGATVYVYVSGMLSDGPSGPNTSVYNIYFEQNDDAHTLVVTSVYPPGTNWDEVSVTGTATLPYGTISVGDEITNCDGFVTLRWSSTNELIGSWVF